MPPQNPKLVVQAICPDCDYQNTLAQVGENTPKSTTEAKEAPCDACGSPLALPRVAVLRSKAGTNPSEEPANAE